MTDLLHAIRTGLDAGLRQWEARQTARARAQQHRRRLAGMSDAELSRVAATWSSAAHAQELRRRGLPVPGTAGHF